MQSLLTPLDVARRIASLAGIIVLITLALVLLWRVYLHHEQADPYDRDEAVTVRLDVRPITFVKIANHMS